MNFEDMQCVMAFNITQLFDFLCISRDYYRKHNREPVELSVNISGQSRMSWDRTAPEGEMNPNRAFETMQLEFQIGIKELGELGSMLWPNEVPHLRQSVTTRLWILGRDPLHIAMMGVA